MEDLKINFEFNDLAEVSLKIANSIMAMMNIVSQTDFEHDRDSAEKLINAMGSLNYIKLLKELCILSELNRAVGDNLSRMIKLIEGFGGHAMENRKERLQKAPGEVKIMRDNINKAIEDFKVEYQRFVDNG